MKRIGLSLFFLLALFHNAFAYLDPGTGSYVLQIFIATVVGSFFAIKIYWENIKKKLRGNTKDDRSN